MAAGRSTLALGLMSRRLTMLAGLVLFAASNAAYGHGEGALFRPLVIAALALGCAVGALCAVRSLHPGIALAATLSLIYLGGVVFAGVTEGAWIEAALLLLLFVPLAAAIPLCLAFFIVYAGTSWLVRVIHDRRVAPNSSNREP